VTTPRDLLTVALDVESDRPVERGDLSLALAGAELVDLLDAQAVRLEDGRLHPGYRPTIADPLLDEAASSLAQHAYESVDDWLWRRGRGLAATYLADFEAEGRLVRRHPRWMPFRTTGTELADFPDRRSAADRLTAHEPVLTGLAAAAGIDGLESGDVPDVDDEAVATVLAAVHDAVEELAAVRQRRAVEQAAFDNIWRGDGE
jgi:hypothetical protein